MASNQERFSAVDIELKAINTRLEAIENAIGILPPKPETSVRQWLSAKWVWVVARPGISIVISLLTCALSIVGGGEFKYWLDHRNEGFNNSVDARITTALNAPHGVTETLKNLSDLTNKTSVSLETLQPYIRDAVTRQFDTTASLAPKVLEDHLSTMGYLLAVAKDQDIHLDPMAARSIGRNLLRVNQDTPLYWPTAGNLISVKLRDPQNLRTSDVDCFTERNPVQTGSLDIFVARNVTWTDCTLRLDDLQGFQKSYTYQDLDNNLLARGGTFEMTLIRVKIVYRGGPLIPFARLHATGCTFNFDFPAVPVSKGQTFVESLLGDFTDPSVSVTLPKTHS